MSYSTDEVSRQVLALQKYVYSPSKLEAGEYF